MTRWIDHNIFEIILIVFVKEVLAYFVCLCSYY